MPRIVAPPNLPPPTSFRPSLRSNVRISTSVASGVSRATELSGHRWLLTAQWKNLREADAGILQSFLVSMNGQANVCDLPLHAKHRDFGALLSLPSQQPWTQPLRVVQAASAGATSFIVSQNGSSSGNDLRVVLNPGDMLSIKRPDDTLAQTVMVATAVDTAAQTIAIACRPRLRLPLYPNDLVEVLRPTCRVMLASNDVALGTYTEAFFEHRVVQEFSIDFLEALRDS
jgi:hypothetical protein